MTSKDGAKSGRPLRYAEHRPYPDPPARLADLTGPIDGLIELPLRIEWSPKRSYDMASDIDRRMVYQAVLQEGLNDGDVEHYLNGSVLVEVWPRLRLPRRVRERWEARFPELKPAG